VQPLVVHKLRRHLLIAAVVETAADRKLALSGTTGCASGLSSGYDLVQFMPRLSSCLALKLTASSARSLKFTGLSKFTSPGSGDIVWASVKSQIRLQEAFSFRMSLLPSLRVLNMEVHY